MCPCQWSRQNLMSRTSEDSPQDTNDENRNEPVEGTEQLMTQILPLTCQSDGSVMTRPYEVHGGICWWCHCRQEQQETLTNIPKHIRTKQPKLLKETETSSDVNVTLQHSTSKVVETDLTTSCRAEGGWHGLKWDRVCHCWWGNTSDTPSLW